MKSPQGIGANDSVVPFLKSISALFFIDSAETASVLPSSNTRCRRARLSDAQALLRRRIQLRAGRDHRRFALRRGHDGHAFIYLSIIGE